MSAPLLPADRAAAGFCWLARWRNGAGAASLSARVDEQVSFWHPGRCRWCSTPLAELMARLETTAPHVGPHGQGGTRLVGCAGCEEEHLNATFSALPAKARAARVREAQEEPWWTEIVEPQGSAAS